MSQNRWHFAFRFNPSDADAADGNAFYSDGILKIEAENAHPPPRCHPLGTKVLFLFGNPIAKGKRDDFAVLELLEQETPQSKGIALLNGSFLLLIYDPERKELTVANDRFAAFGLHLHRAGSAWWGATSLKWLWDRVAFEQGIDETGAAEFLFLRRLLGSRTLAKSMRYLPAASLLHIASDGSADELNYWRPDYSKAAPRESELPGLLADGLRTAVGAHQSDERKFGLLLSGGLDSRAILAAASKPTVCYTTCLRENNESAVARAVAAGAHATFHFVPRPANLYDGVLDDAVFLTGGEQTYVEAQFLTYAERWPEPPDTFLIGLGADIFFGGLYLPKRPARLFGRQALHYKLIPMAADFSDMFLSGVSYRLKQSDPNILVRTDRRSAVRDALRHSIDAVARKGQDCGAQGYDLWEYMHIDTLSRHYSFPMIMSVRSYADCRAPALDNELLDLSIRMTAKQKLNGTAYQKAIAILSPTLGQIRNANTNLPANVPLPRQTLVKLARFAAHKAFGADCPVAPSAIDRSWPSAKQSLESCLSIMRRVGALQCSERLAAISFIDMDGVRTVVGDHLAGRTDHAVMINLLLTLDRALDRTVH
jgi:asparagine synthase (glutamine-hydrolysing)